MADSALASQTLLIACKSCGAELAVEQGLMTADCPYCASPSVVERAPAHDRPRPRFALGFAIDERRAALLARRWLASRGPFAHGGLKAAALERARGIYLPAWLYSAAASARYSASIGEDYTETETYTTTDSKGNTQTHTRTVTRTEWRELAGEWNAYVADVLVTASRGLANEELEAVEPFDLRALCAFGPELIAGWIAEEASLTREACMRTAHEETSARIGKELSAFLPGDSHRNLRFDFDVQGESAELTLLPVWVCVLPFESVVV